MGANAQTTVPTFTAGDVLTAAQMNQSARTGVPVFADTTARDAAFGGSGEKTLAEGQLCYLESTNVVQYYDGSSWATVGPQTVTAPGLELITSQTIGSAVSTVAVTNVFSSTYDNYKIIVSGGVASTTNVLTLQLGSQTSGYYGCFVGGLYTTGAVAGVQNNATANFTIIGQGRTTDLTATIEVIGPNFTKQTYITASNVISTGGYYGTYVGDSGTTTSFTGFTLGTSTGTMTGGTIKVYGYKN